MIMKDSPEPVVPYYVGTSRLEEPADTRKRSWEPVDSALIQTRRSPKTT